MLYTKQNIFRSRKNRELSVKFTQRSDFFLPYNIEKYHHIDLQYNKYIIF